MVGVPLAGTLGWGPATTAPQGAPCGQYISNKRPSRFVILSETKDLARRTEILRFTQDDNPETASFDWQHVLFEMYCPLRVSCGGPGHIGTHIHPLKSVLTRGLQAVPATHCSRS